MSFWILLILIFGLAGVIADHYAFEKERKRRRDYYRDVYLKSDAWKRKRYVVFKRDNWRCVYCGAPATQVHHTRYAGRNIGKEPIKWLVSVCESCHDAQVIKQIKALSNFLWNKFHPESISRNVAKKENILYTGNDQVSRVTLLIYVFHLKRRPH